MLEGNHPDVHAMPCHRHAMADHSLLRVDREARAVLHRRHQRIDHARAAVEGRAVESGAVNRRTTKLEQAGPAAVTFDGLDEGAGRRTFNIARSL